MKKTLFIRTILSVLTTAACFSLSGNTAFAGIHLEYPGCGTDENGNLIITGSPSNNTIHVSTGSIIGAVTGSYSEINDTTGNSVSISGGTIGGTVIGGFAENDDAISNSVHISGGHIGDDVIGGKSSDDAISNSIQISGGMIDGDVLGASSIHGDVTSNSVTISGGTINKDVLGALSETGDAKNNSVFISGGNVEGYVYGANTDEGKAANNSVTISDEAAIDGYVYGAYSKMGSLTNNSVTILGGTIGDNVYGADSGSGDADATNNSVTISGGAVGDSVYGASSGEGDMTGNSVTISNGSIGDDVIGARSALGDLTNNSITISGGTIGNDVSGAHNLYGKMAENSVTISGGFIGGSVYGAQSFGPEPSSEVPDMKRPELGEALNNSVTISGGDISQDVYGALNIQGNATSNIVLIKGTATVDGSVFGAGSAYGKVKSNSVAIEAGNIGENVSGALFILGNAEENTVIIKGGNIAGSVYGASSLLDGPSRETFAMEGPIFGNALKNAVLIEGGTIGRNVYGALNQVGDASGNIAMIKGGTIGKNVFGARTKEGNVTSNSVAIENGSIGKNVFGARTKEGNAASNTVVIQGESEIDGDVYGAFSKNGNATTNTVSISKSIIGNDVYGAFSKKGSVSDNSVTIHEASIDRDVYGAFSKKGDATGNSVAISKSDIGKNVYGGYSRKGSANGNTVNISGGSIGGDVLGGSSFSFEGELEGAPAGTASNNTVQITVGTIGGNIYGGFTMAGNATNNTVILGEKAILSDSAVVAGGWSENLVGFRIADQPEVSDSFTGNRLVLDNFRGTVGEISNFEFIDIKTSGRVEDMLVIKKSEGTELLSESNGTPTDLSNVKVSITFTGIAQRANVGDKFILVRNDDGLITDTMTLTQNGQQKLRRSAYIYDLQFGADETTISATVSDRKFNEQCKALAEGRVASMAHLSMGADLIADQGIDQVVQSTHKAGKFSVFAATAATTSQYDTGSHVDLYGYSVLAGASLRPVALSSLNVGLFAESGWGHYGSFNEFTDGAVRGSGDSEYYGGGVLAHYDLAKAVTKGLSVEASFRTGKTDTDFASGDLPDSRYSLNAPYYGMHAGINYTRQISEKIKMASYGRFFWSHLDGDSALIDGSDFRFNSMNSQRIKAGAKFFYEIAPHITPYAGASYEWECSGTARAVVDTENGMSAPSLRGGTATGELGAIYQPMAERPFWVDLSVQGHVGERQGISGAVKFRAEF